LEKALAQDYKDRKSRFPHWTKEALLEHGKVLLIAATNYYKKVIINDTGDS